MGVYDECMAVDRSRWTDERLDDLAERVIRHEAVGPKVDDLKAAVEDLRREMIGLRDEIRSEINSLRSEFYDTRRWLFTIWLGFAALFVEIALRT